MLITHVASWESVLQAITELVAHVPLVLLEMLTQNALNVGKTKSVLLLHFLLFIMTFYSDIKRVLL